MSKASRRLNPDEHQVIEEAAPALRPIALALRELMLGIHPDATIVAWPRQRIISFGFGPRKMSEHYAFIAVHAEHINLGLYNGARLEQEGFELAGSGKSLRHLKVHALDEALAFRLRGLVERAHAVQAQLLRQKR